MTTVAKDDIHHMKPSQRNKYRRLGFSWSEIKKIDNAIGQGDSTITIKSAIREVTIELPPKWR
ncbi:hypothetical protein [Nonomuraea rosea]